MSALFRNSSFFQHNNPVGISDRFEAVSDNDYRPSRNQGIDSLLHFYFILRIERGSSLIQQHDRSFFQHGTGNGDPLFFSSRKSTMLKLCARFYDPRKGSVRFNGMDMKELEPESLMKHCSMVFQDVYLFQDTLKNNIRFGRTDATDEEIVAAAKSFSIVLFPLPEGPTKAVSVPFLRVTEISCSISFS